MIENLFFLGDYKVWEEGETRPPVIGQYQGQPVYHVLENDPVKIAALKALPEYLASGYLELTARHGDLALQILERKDDQGNVIGYMAPHRFAGVDAQDEPAQPDETFPTQVVFASQVDQAVIQLKARVKLHALAFIKANPACTLDAVLADTSANLDDAAAALLTVLMPIYIGGAFQAGLIAEGSFEAFRNFVAVHPEEVLLAF
jgi:hypothetical protein